MKLNIYKNKEIIKTYEADSYDLMFGTVEDIAEAIDIDNLQTGSEVEILKVVGKLALTSMDTIKNLLEDVFDGISDEELKCVKVTEITTVLLDIVNFTISQLKMGNGSKN